MLLNVINYMTFIKALQICQCPFATADNSHFTVVVALCNAARGCVRYIGLVSTFMAQPHSIIMPHIWFIHLPLGPDLDLC